VNYMDRFAGKYVGWNSTPTVKLNNQVYECDKLSDTEIEIFDTEYDMLFGTETSELKRLLEKKKAHVFQAVRVMKKKLGTSFRGMYAQGSELGWGAIRPYHAGKDAASWSNTFSSAGYTDWLGSSSSPREVYKHHMFVVLAMDNQADKIYTDEVLFNQDGTTWPVVDLKQLSLADNQNMVSIQPLHTMYFMPDSTFYARLLGNAAGTDYPRLIGVSLATGTYLSKETYSSNPPE